MVPIFTTSGGQSLGYNLSSFVERFEEICQQHLKDGRAKAFAFLFYDFNDYLKAEPPPKKEFKYLKHIKAAGKFLTVEGAKVLVKEGIGALFK